MYTASEVIRIRKEKFGRTTRLAESNKKAKKMAVPAKEEPCKKGPGKQLNG